MVNARMATQPARHALLPPSPPGGWREHGRPQRQMMRPGCKATRGTGAAACHNWNSMLPCIMKVGRLVGSAGMWGAINYLSSWAQTHQTRVRARGSCRSAGGPPCRRWGARKRSAGETIRGFSSTTHTHTRQRRARRGAGRGTGSARKHWLKDRGVGTHKTTPLQPQPPPLLQRQGQLLPQGDAGLQAHREPAQATGAGVAAAQRRAGAPPRARAPPAHGHRV
jgi:hypothetical protein